MATQREVAEHLCSNEHRIRELTVTGVFPPLKRGRGGGYDLDLCRKLYIRWLEAQVKDGTLEGNDEAQMIRQKHVDDLAKERARQAAETSEKLAMENAERRRELVPVTELREAMAKVGGLVRANLEAWPAELKRAAPHLRNSEIAVIKRSIAKLSDAIADIDLSHESAT